MKKFLIWTGLVMAAVFFSVNVNAQSFYGISKNPAQVKKIAQKELSGCKITYDSEVAQAYYNECKNMPLACATSIFKDLDGNLVFGLVISYERVTAIKTGKKVLIVYGSFEEPSTVIFAFTTSPAKAKKQGNEIIYVDNLEAKTLKIPYTQVLAAAKKLGIPFDEAKLPYIIPK